MNAAHAALTGAVTYVAIVGGMICTHHALTAASDPSRRFDAVAYVGRDRLVIDHDLTREDCAPYRAAADVRCEVQP